MRNLKIFLQALALPPGDEWQLAFRPCGKELLVDGNTEGFVLIPNTIRYWYADPFLLEHNGETYVFVEAYDRLKKKGTIAWAIIKNGKCSKFKECLNLPFHLSYPCVFVDDGQILMIPECYQSEEITLYRAIEFPHKWEKVGCIAGICAVDTTPISINGEKLLLSTIYESKERRLNDNLCIIKDGNVSVVSKNDFETRCAGHVFEQHGRLIRPVQNCGNFYGENLLFKSINQNDSKIIEENTVMVIGAPKSKWDRRIQVTGKINHEFIGIHTYNKSDNFEIIDLKYRDGKSVIYFIKNLCSWLKEKIK